MKKLTALLPIILLLSKQVFSQSNTIYKLVWSNKFNNTGMPDSTKWGYNLGDGGWGNEESQYYTNPINNAVVKKAL